MEAAVAASMERALDQHLEGVTLRTVAGDCSKPQHPNNVQVHLAAAPG